MLLLLTFEFHVRIAHNLYLLIFSLEISTICFLFQIEAIISTTSVTRYRNFDSFSYSRKIPASDQILSPITQRIRHCISRLTMYRFELERVGKSQLFLLRIRHELFIR